MAVLKYKNGEGQFVTLTNYTVQPITPVQTTGASMSDVMSQKAVTDELEKKVGNSELNSKIASAITNDNTVKQAVETQVATAVEDSAAVKEAIAEAVETSPAISGAINSVVSEAISSDDTVKDAVDEAVADAIANASAVTEAVETVVDTKLVDYYTKNETSGASEISTALEEKANVNHTHNASAITDFDNAIAQSVTNNQTVITSINNTIINSISGDSSVSGAINSAVAKAVDESEEVKNAISDAVENSPAIASAISESVSDAIAEEIGGETGTTIVESIETVVEKYIYGESTPSSSASVVTTDNLSTTLENYAKIGDNVSEFINDANYIVNSEFATYTSATNSALDTKIAGVDYVKDDNKIYFYNNTANSGTALTFIDTTDFVEAGMISGATVEGGKLIIVFYTTSGGTDTVEINISDIFDANNYYTTGETSGATEISNALTLKLNISDFNTYSGSVDTVINGKANAATTIAGYGITDAKIDGGVITLGSDTITPITSLADYYTKSETSGKTEIADALDLKLDSSAYTPTDLSNYYTKNETSGASEISTALNEKSGTGHTHTANDITDFSTAIEENATVQEISGNVSTISGITNYLVGHNTVNTLANIQTNKRLVIATITSSTNELSLSENSLPDGYEIHIIVTNNGANDATITLPSSGGYISVGGSISISSGATGEINIISDGSNLYVRGV